MTRAHEGQQDWNSFASSSSVRRELGIRSEGFVEWSIVCWLPMHALSPSLSGASFEWAGGGAVAPKEKEKKDRKKEKKRKKEEKARKKERNYWITLNYYILSLSLSLSLSSLYLSLSLSLLSLSLTRRLSRLIVEGQLKRNCASCDAWCASSISGGEPEAGDGWVSPALQGRWRRSESIIQICVLLAA